MILLRDFRELNHTAFIKSLKKYDKYLHEYLEHLNGTENPLKDYYMQFIDRSYFVHSGIVDLLLKKTKNHMIFDLCDGNKKLGTEKLENWGDDQKNLESSFFSTGFSVGIGITLTILSIYYYFKHYSPIQNIIPYSSISILLFKTAFLPILLLLLNSFNTVIWKNNNINYVYIFNLNPKTKINPYKFVTVAFIIYDIWISCVYLYMYIVVEENINGLYFAGMAWIIPILMYLFYIFWFIFPLDFLYRGSRYWFLNTCIRIAIAPFIGVQFRDFYIGDQFTSLSDFFFNLQFIICFYPITSSNDDCK